MTHETRHQITVSAPARINLLSDTQTPGGSVYTTKPIRICSPRDRIGYNQLQTPARISVHDEQWLIEADGDGAMIASSHTKVIAPVTLPAALGKNVAVAGARTSSTTHSSPTA